MNTGLVQSMWLRTFYTQKTIFKTVRQAGWPSPGAQSAHCTEAPSREDDWGHLFAIHWPGENECLLAIHTQTMLLLAGARRQL